MSELSSTNAEMSPPIVNIAAYKFAPLDELTQRREALRALTRRLELKGTILLSPEGINFFLAGARAAVDEFVAVLQADPQVGALDIKESYTERQPFGRMLVKLKREIIAFGVEGIDPSQRTSPKLPAKQLKQWLDEGRPVTLLDVRNDYEVALGTFAGAEPIGVAHFRDFPKAVDALPDDRKEETVVMFCTGGIRCEKAGPYMERAGFKNVFQLEGGILKYFEECGAAHYTGECFVFDDRVAVDGDLQATDAADRLAGEQLGSRPVYERAEAEAWRARQA
ncbi:oxygen-dependent tRNA uridine(34) hydroxylase TrhO [Botrimarina mediterranea]|uniref:tRNA uridine(34) hydroxylase n=1 Tax=Botrimarina mediterranea TaxID=2528022 RepID=A0A518KAQ5_9BACT|nr:rhodanese-like domain-containing protein [Botrimarina mediterranea]QDV74870.1 putative adenylyltransferase/sulfurtransferase MoeZ [Botrimarina mediterranea]